MSRQLRVLRVHPKRLIVSIAVATAAIIFLLFVAIAWVLQVSSASLDEAQTSGEAKLLHSLVDDYRASLSRSVGDYTAWTELYQYLKGPKNPNWENDNLGPYIAKTFGIDDVLIVSRGGRIVYSYTSHSESLHPTAGMDTIRKLARLSFAREIPGTQVPVAGFVLLGKVPSLVVASTIRDTAARAQSNFSLVNIRMLSSAALGKLGRNYGIRDLRPVRNAHQYLLLRTPEGTASPFGLAWQPAYAGRALLAQTFPTLLVIGVIASLAFLAMAYVAVRILAHVRAAEQRVQDAELSARDARAQAAEETARTKSTFIANMSHELRTPLNAIIGFSDMMRSETFGPIGAVKYRDYLDAIHDSGTHLLDIVNDILELSKVDAGKSNIRLQAVALDRIVLECVHLTESLAVAQDVRVEYRASGDAVRVVADRQAMKQILLNLISNAVKFSPRGATILLGSYGAGENEQVLRIVDRGCGMAEATLREIGKPFVQAEEVYSRKYQGTGLGLSICFLLARAMSASIDIQSAEGVGTTVCVKLRKAKQDERAVPESAVSLTAA